MRSCCPRLLVSQAFQKGSAMAALSCHALPRALSTSSPAQPRCGAVAVPNLPVSRGPASLQLCHPREALPCSSWGLTEERWWGWGGGRKDDMIQISPKALTY